MARRKPDVEKVIRSSADGWFVVRYADGNIAIFEGPDLLSKEALAFVLKFGFSEKDCFSNEIIQYGYI